MVDYNALFNNIRMKDSWRRVYASERLKTAVPADFHPDRVAFLLRHMVGDTSTIKIAAQLYTSEYIRELAKERATYIHMWSEHMLGISMLAPHDQEVVMHELINADVHIKAGRIENGYKVICNIYNCVMGLYSK